MLFSPCGAQVQVKDGLEHPPPDYRMTEMSLGLFCSWGRKPLGQKKYGIIALFIILKKRTFDSREFFIVSVLLEVCFIEVGG